MDRAWWNEYGDTLRAGPEFWTVNREAARIYGLRFIHGEQGGGVSIRPDSIRMGGNSGFQAVSLALHFGASRVILLGYDMQLTDGRSHWHGDHATLGNPLAQKFKGWHRAFAEIPTSTRACIVNASRATALTCFERMTLHDCLSQPTA